MMLTYRYRIKDRRAKRKLCAYASSVNQVWNWCVAHQRDMDARYVAGEVRRKSPTHFALAALCKGVGPLLGIHQQTVQRVCERFSANRFAIKRAPKFRRSYGARRSLGWVPFQQQSRQVDSNTITYRGERFRFWEGGRPLPASAKGGCFVEDARGRWYVCFDVPVTLGAAGADGEIGIDLGLKTLAVCSDGTRIERASAGRRLEPALARAQRARKKGRTAALHAKIKNARRDWIHKTTTDIANRYSVVAIGDAKPRRLSRTSLAKSAKDAGWGLFRSMLEYKARRRQARFILVDERFTSQTCSCCGVIPVSSPKGRSALGIRSWDCSSCGVSHDRDVNAAKNILRIGRSITPPEEGSRHLG